jgi:CheY-like chemotaxis protein
MARVLVVDDESVIREILSDLLASDGHLVDTAADGSEALEMIHGWRPDVVLLDMMMPEVGAWDFLARYNADSMCRGLPVAILSTTATAGGALEEAGVSAVISNPFDVEDLLETVHELVSPNTEKRRTGMEHVKSSPVR